MVSKACRRYLEHAVDRAIKRRLEIEMYKGADYEKIFWASVTPSLNWFRHAAYRAIQVPDSYLRTNGRFRNMAFMSNSGTELWTTEQHSNDAARCVWNTRMVECQVAASKGR